MPSEEIKEQLDNVREDIEALSLYLEETKDQNKDGTPIENFREDRKELVEFLSMSPEEYIEEKS